MIPIECASEKERQERRIETKTIMHKSKAVHGEGAMVRVDRKCEAYV